MLAEFQEPVGHPDEAVQWTWDLHICNLMEGDVGPLVAVCETEWPGCQGLSEAGRGRGGSPGGQGDGCAGVEAGDRKSTRLNSSH